MQNPSDHLSNTAYTENGALTHRSSGSACVDLFSSIGALRGRDDMDLLFLLSQAYAEDPDLTIKMLFYARDIRGGLGERTTFRRLLYELSLFANDTVSQNIRFIPALGRCDDLLALLNTPCQKAAVRLIREQLRQDQESIQAGKAPSLLGKWLPSINASSPRTRRQARLLSRALSMNHASYRKLTAALRAASGLLENQLRRKDYSFSYEKQPSRALFKYRAAFLRNDHRRYTAYLQAVQNGEARMHTGTLLPYDIIAPCFRSNGETPISNDTRQAMDTAWQALPDFGNAEQALVVADGSGSMYSGTPLPITVALSLAIYYGERNKGPFRGHFITFSESPRLVRIRGRDILEKARYAASFNECANTNLQRVFELLLSTALASHAAPEDMPRRLYIISDMEFDACAGGATLTNFQQAKALFASHGYPLPEVIFWNVSARHRQLPVTRHETGTALISGMSPHLFSLAAGPLIDPEQFMRQVLSSDRYKDIRAAI